MLHLTQLPEDVILEILTHLTFASGREFSLTSKHNNKLFKKTAIQNFTTYFSSLVKKRLPHTTLSHLLTITSHPTAFAGGLVWGGVVGEDWGGDVDIFSEATHTGNLEHQLLYFSQYPDIASVHPGCVLWGHQYFTDVIPFMAEMIMEHNGGNDYKKLADFIFCPPGDLYTRLSEFDIVGCQSWFNGKELYIPDPSNTLYKRTSVAPQFNPPDWVHVDPIDTFCERVLKYRGRGVVFLGLTPFTEMRVESHLRSQEEMRRVIAEHERREQIQLTTFLTNFLRPMQRVENPMALNQFITMITTFTNSSAEEQGQQMTALEEAYRQL